MRTHKLSALLSVSALALLTGLCLQPARAAAAGSEAAAKGFGHDWQSWKAGNDVADLASLQRGARDFMAYCSGCHSLQYLRYSRVAHDLKIPKALLQKYLLPKDAKTTSYITAPMPTADAVTWFGKAPPDLSLMARARPGGVNYLYQYLTTFYVDPSRPTRSNNLALPNAAMPDVLSDLEGIKRAVFRKVTVPGPGGKSETHEVFDHFEQVAPGQMNRQQFDAFVRDLVNFLDYAGEPDQVYRRQLGVWVVLFLLVFTWLAWLLKKEYWKDVH